MEKLFKNFVEHFLRKENFFIKRKFTKFSHKKQTKNANI